VIRVLLVDDQELVRAGLRLILSPEFGFEIAAEAADGAAAVDAVARVRPDVVVMDIRMRGMDGVEATRRIRQLSSSPPVLVLTTFDDDEVLSGALRAGASGFALKEAPGEELVQAVRAVAEGEGWVDPSVAARVLATYRAGAPSPEAASADVAGLTTRELEVVRVIGRGSSNAEIARMLVIGEGTVKTHINHILTKLGLRDRAALIVFAFDHGLVQPRA